MNQPIKDVEEFLEHFGVKGQRWGVRASVSPTGRISYDRSPLQKTAIVGGAIVASMAANKFAMHMLNGGNKFIQPISIVASSVGLLAGARAARTIVDKNNGVPAGTLGGKHINEKGFTNNEKTYLTYQGMYALAAAGLAVALKR